MKSLLLATLAVVAISTVSYIYIMTLHHCYLPFVLSLLTTKLNRCQLMMLLSKTSWNSLHYFSKINSSKPNLCKVFKLTQKTQLTFAPNHSSYSKIVSPQWKQLDSAQLSQKLILCHKLLQAGVHIPNSSSNISTWLF